MLSAQQFAGKPPETCVRTILSSGETWINSDENAKSKYERRSFTVKISIEAMIIRAPTSRFGVVALGPCRKELGEKQLMKITTRSSPQW